MDFDKEKSVRDEFWRHNAVFFTGSMAVSLLNYLYYPVLGRLLSVTDFGEVQTLVSVFLQSTIFFSVMGLIVVNVVTNQSTDQTKDRTVFELEKLALLAAVIGLTIVLVLARQIQVFFQFRSFWPLIALALAIVASVPLTFRQFYLRGRLRFGAAARSAALAAGAKLVLSALLVYMGFRSGGAIVGIVLAQLAALVYTAHLARQAGYLLGLRKIAVDLGRSGGSEPVFSERKAAVAALKEERTGAARHNESDVLGALRKSSIRSSVRVRQSRWLDLQILKPELTYGLLVMAVTLFVTLQFSLDIIVVKHYFPADTAGLYAGITTIARIIYFLTASIGVVLMSSVKLSASGTSNRLVLLRSLGFLMVLGVPALLFFWLAPQFVIKVMLGSKYLAYGSLLPLLSLVMLIISATGLLLNYHLALRRFGVVIPAGIGAGITYFLIILHHASLYGIVKSLLWGSACMLVLVAGWGIAAYYQAGANGE